MPILALGILCLTAVTGFLTPGTELRALQASTADARLADCHKQFSLRAGTLALGLGKCIARFVEIPDEAKVALRSVRGVDFALYEVGKTPAGEKLNRLISDADSRLGKQNWERTVLVREHGNLVAVYNKTNVRRPEDLRFCVLVVDQRNVIMVSARADLRPAIAYLERSGKWPEMGGPLFSAAR